MKMLQRKKRPLILFLSFAILLIYLGFSDYQFIGEAQKLIGEKGESTCKLTFSYLTKFKIEDKIEVL